MGIERDARIFQVANEVPPLTPGFSQRPLRETLRRNTVSSGV